MLSDSDRALLIHAVPSFEQPWATWVASNADYEARFPTKALSPERRSHEFQLQLAMHLGRIIAAGDLTEAGWLFAGLERVFEHADEELDTELTVGFLESLIHVVESEGGDPAALQDIPKGPLVSSAWRAARAYTSGAMRSNER